MEQETELRLGWVHHMVEMGQDICVFIYLHVFIYIYIYIYKHIEVAFIYL